MSTYLIVDIIAVIICKQTNACNFLLKNAE